MRILEIIKKYSTGRNVILLFLITMVVYLTMLFYSIPLVIQAAPDMKLFDLSPSGYTQNYAVSLLNAIGPEGRSLYLSMQLPLDFLYPGLFILSYSFLFAWLLKKSFGFESKVYSVLFIPIFAGLFDYVENILIIRMLKAYPELGYGLVSAASSATVSKSILSSIFFILLSASIFYALTKSIWTKLKPGTSTK